MSKERFSPPPLSPEELRAQQFNRYIDRFAQLLVKNPPPKADLKKEWLESHDLFNECVRFHNGNVEEAFKDAARKLMSMVNTINSLARGDVGLKEQLKQIYYDYELLTPERERYLLQIVVGEVIPRTANTLELQNQAVAEARHLLIMSNQRLVIFLTRRLRGVIPLGDILQAGTIGLQEAIDRFDLSKNTRFSTYASHWIRGELQKLFQKQASNLSLPLNIVQAISELNRKEGELTQLLEREPSFMELAKAMNKNLGRIKFLFFVRRMNNAVSLNDRTWKEDDDEIGESIADEDTTVESSQEKEERMKVTISLIATLTDWRTAYIIYWYDLVGDEKKRFQEIAQELQLHQNRVGQIRKEGLEVLRENGYFRRLSGSAFSQNSDLNLDDVSADPLGYREQFKKLVPKSFEEHQLAGSGKKISPPSSLQNEEMPQKQLPADVRTIFLCLSGSSLPLALHFFEENMDLEEIAIKTKTDRREVKANLVDACIALWQIDPETMEKACSRDQENFPHLKLLDIEYIASVCRRYVENPSQNLEEITLQLLQAFFGIGSNAQELRFHVTKIAEVFGFDSKKRVLDELRFGLSVMNVVEFEVVNIAETVETEGE
jgi:RNA polymerase sigma factor (sigma-70 family)